MATNSAVAGAAASTNYAALDAWEKAEADAQAIPPMPHFWAAGRHAGILRRKDLKDGYNLLRNNVGGFGGYVVDALPGLIAALFFGAGFVSGLGVDWQRPGGWLGPNCAIIDGRLVGDYGCELVNTTATLWSPWHTMIFAAAMGLLGHILAYYVWQPLTWYNHAWGDVLCLEERGGECKAVLRTKLHRLCYANRQSAGYYRGNAADGHIAKARILLRYTPAQRDEHGNVIGGWHTGGLAHITIADLYSMDAGVGHCTDDPGRAYENLRMRMQHAAERARRIDQRGVNRFLKLETGLVIIAVTCWIVGGLLMLSITGGGAPVVDPGVITDTVGLSN